MAEWTGFENRRARKGSGGSNPPLSVSEEALLYPLIEQGFTGASFIDTVYCVNTVAISRGNNVAAATIGRSRWD